MFLRGADTVSKRVGVILIIVSAITLIVTIIFWNANNKPFLYKHVTNTNKKPHLPIAPEGHKWRDNLQFAWELHNEECLKAKTRDFIGRYKEDVSDCRIETIPYLIERKVEYKSSFKKFIRRSFMRPRYAYFWFVTPSTLILLLGLLMYKGIYSRIITWVRTG